MSHGRHGPQQDLGSDTHAGCRGSHDRGDQIGVPPANYEETEEESFYSGYTYFHPTLLLTYRLTDEISLDLFADHDPEWHKQKEDDFTTSLLSCSLSYRLP